MTGVTVKTSEQKFDFDSYEDFAAYLKNNKITYAKLKKHVFGNTSIRAIKSMRKDPTQFYRIIRNHQLWYMINYAINQVYENEVQ